MPVAPGTYGYWLAPWVWEQRVDAPGYWRPPTGAVSAVDLRPLAAQVVAGGVPDGFGFFAIDPAAPGPAGGLLLGNDLNAIVNTNVKRDAESRLELTAGDFAADTVLDNGWLTITDLADPTGSNRVKPLMPTVRGELEFHLQGHSLVKVEKFDRVRHPFVRGVLRHDYQRLAGEQGVNRRPDFASHVLSHIQRKYGYAPGEIAVPSGGATYTDDFDRANNDVLGSPWTETAGDIDISSNYAWNGVSGVSTARYDSDLDSDDHYVDVNTYISTNSNNRYAGPAGRYNASAQTYYFGGFDRNGGVAEDYVIFKTVSGTDTSLASNTGNSDSVLPTLRLEMNGSALTLDADTVEKVSVTDTAITGNVRAGIRGEALGSNRNRWNNWEAGDLVAGGQVVRRHGFAAAGVGR